jgi:hypothetical protein
MSKFGVPDTLVLKLEEYDHETNEKDNTIFIFYDKKNHYFFVRGKRSGNDSYSYSFQCEFASDLAIFINYLISDKNKVNEVLYNYVNLGNDSNDITYDFLSEHQSTDYEISGYNNFYLSDKRLVRNLRMLRNVFNYYK